MKFKRGDLPEPPPPGWDKLGVHPAYTVRDVPDALELDRLCKAAGVSMGEYGKGRFGACVDKQNKQVFLPAWADPERRAALIAHEGGGHTWGLTHGDRHRGWVGPDGQPAKPLSDAQVQMMISMALAEQRQKPRGLIGGMIANGK